MRPNRSNMLNELRGLVAIPSGAEAPSQGADGITSASKVDSTSVARPSELARVRQNSSGSGTSVRRSFPLKSAKGTPKGNFSTAPLINENKKGTSFLVSRLSEIKIENRKQEIEARAKAAAQGICNGSREATSATTSDIGPKSDGLGFEWNSSIEGERKVFSFGYNLPALDDVADNQADVPDFMKDVFAFENPEKYKRSNPEMGRKHLFIIQMHPKYLQFAEGKIPGKSINNIADREAVYSEIMRDLAQKDDASRDRTSMYDKGVSALRQALDRSSRSVAEWADLGFYPDVASAEIQTRLFTAASKDGFRSFTETYRFTEPLPQAHPDTDLATDPEPAQPAEQQIDTRELSEIEASIANLDGKLSLLRREVAIAEAELALTQTGLTLDRLERDATRLDGASPHLDRPLKHMRLESFTALYASTKTTSDSGDKVKIDTTFKWPSGRFSEAGVYKNEFGCSGGKLTKINSIQVRQTNDPRILDTDSKIPYMPKDVTLGSIELPLSEIIYQQIKMIDDVEKPSGVVDSALSEFKSGHISGIASRDARCINALLKKSWPITNARPGITDEGYYAITNNPDNPLEQSAFYAIFSLANSKAAMGLIKDHGVELGIYGIKEFRLTVNNSLNIIFDTEPPSKR